MDKSLRNTLRNTVTHCRRLLEDAIAELLQGQFGIHLDGKIEDAASLGHLSEEDREYRAQILVHLAHIGTGGQGSGAGKKKQIANSPSPTPDAQAVAQLIREVAFTHLNRLAAYKMMETRGLIRESVSRGVKSQGFLFYLADHPEDEKLWLSGQQERAYRHFLTWLGETLSQEIGVLFSPDDPANRLLPPQRVLDGVLDLLNSADLAAIWAEDETIGWIYQYFTPKELRDQARSESRSPRNSYELAFRNQFYTPRYVVQFLTDNTLGRIWYEMRRGETVLAEKCQYLVRRPNEVFLTADRRPTTAEANGESANGEIVNRKSEIVNPVYIPHRKKKDPRDLKILDPASGSGHFLLYCFDLLEIIYEEAYADPDLGPVLQADYPTLADLRQAIPALILRHNLHGIDIDPRAVQIASLALWLRAKKRLPTADGRPLINDASRITKMNIVCAEPMPGNAALLDEFTAGLQPPLLGQLLRAIVGKMELAGEAGSLLKIEEEIDDALTAAKKQWLAGPKLEQLSFFPQEKKSEQLSMFDLTGISDEQFWDEAESRLLAALRDYAEHTSGEVGLARRLFADDTAQGFAFIDLCRQRFDVVLMNPPFGVATDNTKIYFNNAYPDWNSNLLCCFIERMISLVEPRGKIGAIYDKTAWIKLTYENFRRNILLHVGAFDVSADLGWEVLDANVEVVASVTEISPTGNQSGVFFDLRFMSPEEKGVHLLSYIFSQGRSDSLPWCFATKLELQHLPNAVIAYDILPFVKRLFSLNQSFMEAGFQVYTGAQIRSEQHFSLFWERPQHEVLGAGENYCHLYNGGENIRFYIPARDVALFGLNGSKVDQTDQSYTWRLRLDSTGAYYFKPGIGYGKRGDYLDAHFLRANHLFTVEGLSMPIEHIDDTWLILGLLNSSSYQVIINTFCGQHKYAGYINLLPLPEIDTIKKIQIIALVKEQYFILNDWYKHDLTTLTFRQNHVLSIKPLKSLKHIGRCITDNLKLQFDILKRLYKELNRLVEDVCRVVEKREIYEVRNVENEILESGLPSLEDINLFSITTDLIDYIIGLAFGFWDVRLSLNSDLIAEIPPPPESLPSHPPAVLVTPKGLLATSGHIVSEEWLRVRPNAISLPPEGSVSWPTIPDSEYPLTVDWDGILVDDPNHPDDLLRRVREVIEVLWGSEVGGQGSVENDQPPAPHPQPLVTPEEIEREACEILGVRDLQAYFRNPGNGGFWQDHVKRYSKSRRKAPIYWLLQSSRKNYALWLYYHRLDKDILYKALVNYVEPKIRLEESKLEGIRSQLPGAGSQGAAGGRSQKALEKELDQQESFVAELHDFRDKLRRAANLNLEPDLNDGVVLNIAPLWELVPWKEARQSWEELLAGKYEWSSVGRQLREKGLVKE